LWPRATPQIATIVGVSPTTAKWHVSEILRKLRLQRRVQLALYARERGLVRDSHSAHH
jgi:DNA-binding NarL/FixJ family response regulator